MFIKRLKINPVHYVSVKDNTYNPTNKTFPYFCCMSRIQHMQKATGRVLRESGEYINWADEFVELLNRGTDQAGRLRTSQPIPLGDYKCINDRLPLFFDTEVNGTGTVAFNSTLKSHNMQTAADGDWAVVQTFQSHNYFAGKSQFIEITSFDFDDETNIEKRLGYYNSSTTTPFTADLDGFYIYTDGTTHYLRIVNNGTEILNIPQSEWDDPLNGSGESKFTINWANFNVFQASFLWLGGTGLRLSIVVGADVFLVHTYTHVGSVNSDKLIFASPNKPIRYEIRQTGAGSGQFQPVCATVATEGSDSTTAIGGIRSVDVGASDIINASAGTEYVIKGLRLKSGYKDVTIDLVDVDVFVETINDNFRWRLHLNPVLNGTPSWADVTDSSVQESTGNGTLAITTAGIILGSGYGSSQGLFEKQIQTARKIGYAIDGTLDEVWLTVEPIEGSINLNTFGAITYKEFI